jgi:hypothetical protein
MRRTSRLVLALAGALALCALLVATAAARPAAQTAPGDLIDPRTYEPKSKLFLVLHATGVQRYLCQPDGTWLFSDPVATLYKENGKRKPVGSHFLDFATGRPVWRFQDGSSVEAARKASVPAAPGDIPLLLLEAVATAEDGDGDKLARTTWVQRLSTSGGVAPAGACVPGAVAAVPYSSDHLFWRAKGSGSDD